MKKQEVLARIRTKLAVYKESLSNAKKSLTKTKSEKRQVELRLEVLGLETEIDFLENVQKVLNDNQ